MVSLYSTVFEMQEIVFIMVLTFLIKAYVRENEKIVSDNTSYFFII